MSSLTLTGCLYNWQLFQQAVQLMVREGVMAANTNEGFSQRHRPQNRSVKDGAIAVIWLDFYLRAFGSFGFGSGGDAISGQLGRNHRVNQRRQ